MNVINSMIINPTKKINIKKIDKKQAVDKLQKSV